jgi:hypothetical protein
MLLLRMTEDEWNECEDAAAMLRHLGGRAGERRLRLLAAACARAGWSGITDAETRSAVELAERSADGQATREELLAAEDDLWGRGFCGVPRDPEANRIAGSAVHPSTIAAVRETTARVPAEAPALIRDIFGNPFREARALPGRGDEDWRALAQAIHDERRLEELPRLARLLVETGHREQAVLAHLRSPGPHVRGCWALDAVLGKDPGKEILTDADWMEETHPFRMLDAWRFLRGEPSSRKLRLLACACCRLFPPLLAEEPLVRAIDLAEAFADGRAGPEALAEAHAHASALATARGRILGRMGGSSPERTALIGASKAACAAASASGPEGSYFGSAIHDVARDGGRGRDTEDAHQARLLRELLGNPLQQIASRERWLPRDDGAIRELARAIEGERAFARLPALADRLEEAGCADAALLGHLREPALHVQGCWALDAVLGR